MTSYCSCIRFFKRNSWWRLEEARLEYQQLKNEIEVLENELDKTAEEIGGEDTPTTINLYVNFNKNKYGLETIKRTETYSLELVKETESSITYKDAITEK